jgi:hypothetical protein
MNHAVLLAASRREHALFEELLGAYAAIGGLLADDDAPVDPGAVAAENARAERTTGELRALAASLAPHRLTGASVPSAVRELWRASAALAARAAQANAALTERARARQAAVAAQLAAVRAGRRGLAAYRPAGDARRATTVA